MAINPADEPVAAPVLYGAAALFTFIGWVACAGLNWAWGRSFGRVAEWFANALDAVAIKIPFAGTVRLFGTPAALIRAADHGVRHGLGAAALGCEYAWVYTSSHAAASVRQLGRFLDELGGFEVALVQKLVHVAFPRVERRANTYAHRIAGVVAREQARAFDYRLRLARAIGVAAEAEAVHAYRAAAHALDYSEAWVGRTAKQARAESRRIARLEALLGGAGAVALVATALGKLGLRWLRCNNVKKVGRRLCGLDVGLLESLLTDSLEVAALTDLCAIVALSERAAEEFEPTFATIIALQDNLCLFGGASVPSAVEKLYPERTDWLPSAV